MPSLDYETGGLGVYLLRAIDEAEPSCKQGIPPIR